MGTLNPYRVPFLDGNWIIHTANTIGVNHFQLKLISEMFEMFVLLINEINPNSFCFVTFLFIFTREALPHRGSSTPSFALHIWGFAVAICRKNLLQEFAVGIYRRYLPWEFALDFLYIQANPFLYMWVNLVYMEVNLFYMCAKLFDL